MIQCATWEEQRNLKCIFPVVCDVTGIEIERVYPLQQKWVFEINKLLKEDSRVVAVVLFGSSVNMRCTKNSDLDIVVRLKPEFVNNQTKNEISEKIQEACNWNADILWYDRLQPTDRIYSNVLKGVQIV